jgi:UDP-N-acetyl-D-mannosaminuronic acid transferase (WecB/TagA/CpsF family)
VAKEARPALMDALNEAVKHDIDRIKESLPKFTRGAKEGENTRVTVNAEDVAQARSNMARGQASAPASSPARDGAGLVRELNTISLDVVHPDYELAIVLRAFKAATRV